MTETTTTIQLSGTRFGPLRLDADALITFPEGLVGFSKLKRFALLPHNDEQLFWWLQSIEEEGFAFPVTDPRRFLADYCHPLSPQDLQTLCASQVREFSLWCMVTVPRESPDELWLNLQAPLLIEGQARLGKQLVLDASQYPLRYRVFMERKSDAASDTQTAPKHTHR